MDCYVLSSNAILAAGVSIGIGVGGTSGIIMGWTGHSLSRVVVPASVKETVTPLYKDLGEILNGIEELKKIPGAAATINATNSTSKTEMPSIARMEELYSQYENQVQKLEKDLKEYTYVYLFLTEAGRHLRAELKEVTNDIDNLKSSVNQTATQARRRNLRARVHQQRGRYGDTTGADEMTSESFSLMEILGQERQTPLHLTSDSQFAPPFLNQPGSHPSVAAPVPAVRVA